MVTPLTHLFSSLDVHILNVDAARSSVDGIEQSINRTAFICKSAG